MTLSYTELEKQNKELKEKIEKAINSLTLYYRSSSISMGMAIEKTREILKNDWLFKHNGI